MPILHASEELISNELEFPDTLLALWRSCHHYPGASDSDAAVYLNGITTHLINTYKNKQKSLPLDEQLSHDEIEDEVVSYLAELMKKPYAQIEKKNKFSYLVNDLAKQITCGRNRSEYEFHGIIREAFKSLEKSCLVERDEQSKGKTISNNIKVKLVGSPDREAKWEDYLAGKNQIPKYTTTKRKGSVENSKIIAPKDAEKLVTELLTAFNGWITFDKLFSAAKKHVPEDSFFHVNLKIDGNRSSSQTDDEQQSPLEIPYEDPGPFHSEDSGQYLEEFFGDQKDCIVMEKTGRIWSYVCKMNRAELFCLYTLPLLYYNKDKSKVSKKLEDFGSTSTMGDSHAKIFAYIYDEFSQLPTVKGFRRIAGSQCEATGKVILEIVLQLNGRCTENNYNPHLDIYERQ